MARAVLVLSVALAVAVAADAFTVPSAAASAPSAAASALRMLVTPRSGPSPALIRIQLIVEPASDNRALRLTIESDAYYRSSAIELQGSSSQRVHVIEFRSVPAGVHEVRGAIVDDRGSVRATAYEYIRIFE